MAHQEVERTASPRGLPLVVDRLGGLGLIAVLGVAVLGGAAGGPEWLYAWHVATAVVGFAGLLIFGRVVHAIATGFDSRLDPYRIGVQLFLLVALLGMLYQSRTPGYGVGVTRSAVVSNAFAALVVFCVLAGDPRRYSLLQWVVIACVATVVGIFFYHSVSIAETSLRSRHPLWWGSVMAVGLLVVPQYLSQAQFLWAVDRFAAGLVVVALPVYVVGEYTLFGLSVGLHGAYTVPIVGYEVPATRSVFVNRNAFAVVVFAGVIAAVTEIHRAYRSDRTHWTMLVPLALLGINAVGLAIAYGRALWVITPMVLGVYVAYLAFGRRAVPVAIAGGLVYLVAGIAAVHSGVLPLPEGTPTRANRWYPALRAVLDQPSLFGRGLVNPGMVIAEYHPTGSAGSPHNSYLTMAIRAGLLGGVAYLVLIVSSLLEGLSEVRATGNATSVGVLALGVGFAAHQLFEAYTLFNWGSSTVLAVLAFGFLAFGALEAGPTSQPDQAAVHE